MLIINFTDTFARTWHVGESKEDVIFSESALSAVESIQADGDELEHILRTFQTRDDYTIPVPKSSVRGVGAKSGIVWYGDMAKTILANL